ncbi:MAG: DUF1816 domain-containing protein [Cyanobacteria bacterium P01_G01_bin.38]
MKLPLFRLPASQRLKKDWWIKIQTEAPICTYYFGPFEKKKEAKTLQIGYVDDLVQEGAKNIAVEIEKTHPQHLTVCEY